MSLPEYKDTPLVVSRGDLTEGEGKEVWVLGTLLHYLQEGCSASRLELVGGARVNTMGPGLRAPSDLEYKDVLLLGKLENDGGVYSLRTAKPGVVVAPFPGESLAEVGHMYAWAGRLDRDNGCHLAWDTGKEIKISGLDTRVVENGARYWWLVAVWDSAASETEGWPNLSPHLFSFYLERGDLSSLAKARGERAILQGQCFRDNNALGMLGLLLEDGSKVELILRENPDEDFDAQALLLGKLYGEEMAGLGMSRTRAHDERGTTLPRMLVDRLIEIPQAPSE